MPQHVLLLAGEIIVRLENGKLVIGGLSAEHFLPYSHLLSVPALHAAVIDAQRSVGDDQLLVYSHYLSEALTFRAGTSRRVECEHVLVGLLEAYSVCFVGCGEVEGDFGREEYQAARAVAFIESRFGGVGES